MIQVESIRIKEFRGIRTIALTLNLKSFIDACRQFLNLFRCDSPNWGSFIYVSVQTGKEESLRRACGGCSLNLRNK